MDPCEPRVERAANSDGLILYDPPVHVANLLSYPLTPMYTTHVALRGTYIPGTVRCTSGHHRRYPSYSGPGGLLVDALFIYCFADARVNSYLLGTGPSVLTVIVERSLYIREGDNEDYGLEQLESRRIAYERALTGGGVFEFDEPPPRGHWPATGRITGPLRFHDALSFIAEGEDDDPPAGITRGPLRLVAAGPPGGIGGTEVVLFIGPSYNTSIEAWEVRYTWNVERRDDGAVVAIHPYRGWYGGPEAYGVKLEMELPDLAQAVTAAHQARVAEYGGRIGEDDSLPMMVTDANRLRQYFSDPKVGGYAPGVPTPAQPPPMYAPAPATLTATGSGEDTANLSWGAVSGASSYQVQHRETGETAHILYYYIPRPRNYHVHRQKDGEDRWTTVAESATGTNHTVTGLWCGSTHEFRVSARGDGTTYNTRTGLWSPTATATLDSCARHQPQSRDDSHSFEVEAGASVGNSVGVVSTIDVNEDPITRAIAATTARQP